MRSAPVTYGAITVGAGLWCILLFAPSILAAAGVDSPALNDAVYRFFRPICHQMDGRTWHPFGHMAAVCHRCSSVYVGFFAGALAYPLFRRISEPVMPGRKLLLAAAVPMAIDVAGAWLGLFEGTTFGRVVTGGWFGVLIPFLILPGAIEGVRQLLTRTPTSTSSATKGTSDA
jgi:uncharacterized membrane protein